MTRPFLLLALACVASSALAFAPAPVNKDPKGPAGRFVVMKTSAGTIRIELFADKAPKTVANFLKYVDDRHYDGTIFHRVIENFMIQGGGYGKGLEAMNLKNREKQTRAAIKNESANGLENKRGTIAMARAAAPDSATAQFFINVKDNDFLNQARARDRAGYCVFGKVVGGMDVVDKIKAVKTRSLTPGFGDVPVEEVVIESVKRDK